MSGGAASRPASEADPWWVPEDGSATSVVDRDERRRRARRTPRRPASLPARVVFAVARVPLWLLTTLLRRIGGSDRVRRLGTRAIVVGVVGCVLACSVGVIYLNNLVIRRTAELGELDHERSELRRDNALLGAEAARKSAPPRVAQLAERRLGMMRPDTMPTFVYLLPTSRTLTPFQRQRLAARRAADAARKRNEPAGATPRRAATTTTGAPDDAKESTP